jgi:hypothetical protein
MPANPLPSVAPVTRRLRAFFAPVNRATAQPTLWDPSNLPTFNPASPPAPWLDLGWCSQFVRVTGTKVLPLFGGAPANVTAQVRTEIEASVSLEFESWGKLQLALSAGVQQRNILSGGPVPLTAASTALELNLGAPASGFHPGDLVAVDVDYTGQTGFVGSGVSGGYVKSSAVIGPDVDYIRSISLNVSRVVTSSGGVLTLAAPLLAGAPSAGMQVSHVVGFCDREGGSFFQEWSALFLADGEQGDRIVFHYPRLQAITGAAERAETLDGVKPGQNGLARLRLAGSFRALPVTDATDGEQIVCFRSYLPAPNRLV